jgi:hypothetical protein
LAESEQPGVEVNIVEWWMRLVRRESLKELGDGACRERQAIELVAADAEICETPNTQRITDDNHGQRSDQPDGRPDSTNEH